MNDDDNAIETLAEALVSELIAANWMVATAESCTGGWIAKAITDIAGSSAVLGQGIVSYSNRAKVELLDVDRSDLERAGAVSEPVVSAMATGVLRASGADVAVAVSGVAGPGGGTADKPVGTVWLAWAWRDGNGIAVRTDLRRFDGDRRKVRSQAVVAALQGVREIVRDRG